MDLAAVAAFVAAGLTLVNVGITARLAGRAQREQWRRDEERPIVARCLRLTGDICGELGFLSVARNRGDLAEENAHSEKALHLTSDLRFEVAQLDLLASSHVSQVARDLLERVKHLGLAAVFSEPEADYDPGDYISADILALQAALVEGARTDLGVSVAKPNTSLLAAINGRRRPTRSPALGVLALPCRAG